MSSMQRSQLYKLLPLPAPLSLHIYPSFYCNLRCNYCLHSLSGQALEKKGFHRQLMDFDLYRKAVEDAARVGWRTRALIFAGHGEPLMHPQIAEMIACAKEHDITDRTEIVTNGVLLTHELSEKLIDAGLDRLRISVQSTSSEGYLSTCSVRLNYEQFLEQLHYFYQKKAHTDVYVKIIDAALNGQDDESFFHQLFSACADTLAVEHIIPFVPEIELNKLSGQSKQGGDTHSSLCSMPFYMLVLYPNGDVLPCCSTDIPVILGNIRQQSLADIWNSKKHLHFILQQLNGAKTIPVCRTCSVPSFGLQEGDRLDQHEKTLIQQYRAILEGNVCRS